MARITVEDCLDQVPNAFDLVLFASQRARELTSGAPILVSDENDKNTVIALREIASDLIPTKLLEEAIITSYQKNKPFDDSLGVDQDCFADISDIDVAKMQNENRAKRKRNSELIENDDDLIVGA